MYRQLLLIIFINCVSSQMSGVSFTFSSGGMQFLPLNPVELIDTLTVSSQSSAIECARACITRLPYCHTSEFDPSTLQCRLFEGDLTTGQIIPSTSSSVSTVATIDLLPELFTGHNQPCSQCVDNRFLTCINDTCQCAANTYFDGSICKLQQFTGPKCNSNNMCRTDLNLTCLQFFQCGPPSVLIGVTVAGYDNGTSGLNSMALNGPCSIYVTPNNNLYVNDCSNNRVQKFLAGSRVGTTLVGDGSAGDSSGQLNGLAGIYVDALTEDVYVVDSYNQRIQKVSSVDVTHQGYTVVDSDSSPSVMFPSGVRLDARGNLYVSDYYSGILRWSANTAIGTTIGDPSLCNWPDQIELDASGEYMYIPDRNNQRILKISVNVTTPAMTGELIAGGNGMGCLPDQLYQPQSVSISKKTGAIYIADSGCSRVQRWDVGATEGVTIAGSVQGVAGVGADKLNSPRSAFLDANETYLYVADTGNSRVQRFTLI